MYDLEKIDKIVSVFSSNECIAKLIKKEKHKQIFTKTLCTVSLFACDIFVSTILELNWIGWIISLCLTFLFSCFLFNLYNLFHMDLFVGKIESINHDYRLEVSKGTGGFARVHSPIREKHHLVITLCNTEGGGTKKDILCHPQYETIFKPNDIVLSHPLLKHPANLSNKSKCICMNCGTTQSSEKEYCFHCNLILFNYRLMI